MNVSTNRDRISERAEAAAWVGSRLRWEDRLTALAGAAPPVPATRPPVLAVENVYKWYGPRRALDGVSLQIGRGEIVALLGPNGAGKSTLVSIVAGLRRPDEGTVHIGPFDVTEQPAAARALVGFAPQDTGLYEVLTVTDNLRLFGELAGLRRRRLAARLDAVAVAMRLTSFMSRPVNQLSGGERRRLHTAIAFLARPALLLLDEPTVGADVETRAALLDVVRDVADQGAAIMYSTHYLPEVEALAGAFVTIIVGGRVIADGRVDELVRRFGVAVVELHFEGAAPMRALRDANVTIDGSTLRIRAAEPARAAAQVVAELGDDTRRLRAIELVHPSLESVFLTLTGRRYDADAEHAAEDVVVPA
jgi:ABC-2 type transport system ATP-binding protein